MGRFFACCLHRSCDLDIHCEYPQAFGSCIVQFLMDLKEGKKICWWSTLSLRFRGSNGSMYLSMPYRLVEHPSVPKRKKQGVFRDLKRDQELIWASFSLETSDEEPMEVSDAWVSGYFGWTKGMLTLNCLTILENTLTLLHNIQNSQVAWFWNIERWRHLFLIAYCVNSVAEKTSIVLRILDDIFLLRWIFS